MLYRQIFAAGPLVSNRLCNNRPSDPTICYHGVISSHCNDTRAAYPIYTFAGRSSFPVMRHFVRLSRLTFVWSATSVIRHW